MRIPAVGAAPHPLVVVLHGYASNSAQVEGLLFQLGGRTDAAGWLLVAPDGAVDPNTLQYWNATDACCDFFGSGIDDASYLLALVDAIDEELGVDPRQVFFVGHSNGGFMAYRMACDHADRVAGVVSFAGATFDDEQDCTPSRPVPVLQIHGTADTSIQYGGGDLGPGSVSYPGAIETVETWASYDGCHETSFQTAASFDGLSGIGGAETAVRRYEIGCGGPAAELWTIQGGSHAPLDVTAELRDRLFAWLRGAGSRLHRDGFETGDGTVWDRADPAVPVVPP